MGSSCRKIHLREFVVDIQTEQERKSEHVNDLISG